jgi:hypothetical protein
MTLQIGLIILQTFAALLAVLSPRIPVLKRRSKMVTVIAVALIVIVAIFQLTDRYQASQKAAEEATIGQLDFGSKINWVALGSSGARFDPSFLSNILARSPLKNDLRLRHQNGTLLVSCIIRGSDGLVIAEITDNQWLLRPSRHWDRNYTNDALEVKGPTGEVVLQVWTTEDTVRINMKLFTRDGLLMYMGDSGDMALYSKELRGYTNAVFYFQVDKSKLVRVPTIWPIFMYPSDKYLGKIAPVSSRRLFRN